MTRHTRADRDLAALLADASPDVAEANAPALAALRAWPGMALRYRPSQSLDPQELILPLAAGGAR